MAPLDQDDKINNKSTTFCGQPHSVGSLPHSVGEIQAERQRGMEPKDNSRLYYPLLEILAINESSCKLSVAEAFYLNHEDTR